MFQMIFFFLGGGGEADSHNHVLGQDGRVQRERYGICERLAYTKKVFKSCVVFFKICMKSRERLN